MDWGAVESWLARDDRCVLPLGSVEQHAYLSLATDQILSDRMANEAAEPLGLPVFPVLAYGMTPGFRSYPGTISLRMSTYVALIEDLLDLATPLVALAATPFAAPLLTRLGDALGRAGLLLE